ncbi:CopD family protein [Gordonia sp. TBRC 11910]|uniref:CopD family protein n=1 Tax=Gordonia asplenii TaxID=2725283 RepID=A0A848LAZ3_9ACTN|nr:CopD family protein [Gordonia asplenii]NMO04748.1 CopD family protein [Gordonia asplenii]
MSWNILAAGPQPPAPPTVGTALIWSVYFAALALAVGLGLTVGVLAPDGPLARRARRLAVPIAVVVAVTAVLALAELASTRQGTSLWSGLAPSTLQDFFIAPHGPGKPTGLTLAQMMAYLLLVAALIAWRVTSARGMALIVLALGVTTVVIPQLPVGPLLAQRVATGTMTALHFTAVVLWIGGLLILAILGILGRWDAGVADDDAIAADWAGVWGRFSNVALCSVGVLIVTGTWMAWTHVGSPAQLFTTHYGRLLLAKLVVVMLLVCAGAYNTRVLLPRLAAARAADDRRAVWRLAVEHFPKVVAVEAVLGLTVLVIVPFLSGSARMQGGSKPARSFDLTVFGTGALLTALVAATLVAGTRVAVVRRGPERELTVTPR